MKYDIAIIGGGPAGMMAAGRAGELGSRVIIIEKNHELGQKLLVSGGGRCNLTNNINNPKLLAEKYLPSGKFLISAFTRFGPGQVIEFFNHYGLKTKEEKNSRIFPFSDSAIDVLKILKKYLKDSGVTVKTGSAVQKIISSNNRIEKIILNGGEEIIADKYLIAVGGKSYPALGTTGDGYKWLEQLGHKIIEPLPGLSPLHVKEGIVKDLAGLSLSDLKIIVTANNKKILTAVGEAIFSFSGLSGPLAHDLSNRLGREVGNNIKLHLDFAPDESVDQFDKKFQKLLDANGSKTIKNCLHLLFPPKLALALLKIASLDYDTKAGLINRDKRLILVTAIKDLTLSLKGVAGFEIAMVTVGGVALTEVDPKTMKSKIVDNLYLAGEILDVVGQSGGYNLQLCWSTGYIAGTAMAVATK